MGALSHALTSTAPNSYHDKENVLKLGNKLHSLTPAAAPDNVKHLIQNRHQWEHSQTWI